ncbi:MAG: hypothetical protein V7K90_29645 [Nostoc sp.]|uniref:hypothetical protein n=1 Tax=Nostoc sp. TaxID=1180 RepID=UPI002FFA2DA0
MKPRSDVYDGLRLRSIFQFNLEMNERSPFANEHENRTAKDAKGAKEERRRSDRCLKLILMAIAAKI